MIETTRLNDFKQKESVFFTIVHPLDDVPEQKVDTGHLGPMQMTRTVRVCLYALRGYLILMFLLLGFRVLQLAGAIRP